jgi:hypothetical protein
MNDLSHKDRRALIRSLESKCLDLRRAILKLTEECKHSFSPLSSKDLADEWMSVGARCVGCGKDFGWRCKKSPDSACHYYSTCPENSYSDGQDNYVEGIDGKHYTIPSDHDAHQENEDHCIYCGNPEERK